MEDKEELELSVFTLRLPKELDTAVQKNATAEKRSKNSQIAFILEQYIKTTGQQSTQFALSK